MKYKLLPRIITYFMVAILFSVSLQLIALYATAQSIAVSVDNIYMETQYSIIDNIYNKEVESLRLLVTDYAAWDDMYNNIYKLDYKWSSENATFTLLDELSYNVDGVFVEGLVNDYYEYYGQMNVEDYILKSDYYQKLKLTNAMSIEAVRINDEVYLLAGSPVTTSDQRRLNGYYIIARKITDDYIDQKIRAYLNIDEYLGVNITTNESEETQKNHRQIIVPYQIIDNNNNVLKEVNVYFDMTRYHKNYDKLVLYTILITITVATIFFVCILYMSKKMYSLLERTITSIDRVAKGDYSFKIMPSKNYELNQLVSHVNNMGSEIGSQIERLQENHIDTLSLLISAIEEKDQYTRGHSERVTEIALIIASELDVVEVQLLEESALLHDIGKIGIHDDVLSKPDKLTAEEYELIKKHPEMGERILKASSKLSRVATVIRHHHERVDGKGYPDGLVGDEIEIEARIIAVADAFDAMTSKRPYRNEMSFDEGLEILDTFSGTQFDTSVVNAFKEKEDIIRKYIQKHLS